MGDTAPMGVKFAVDVCAPNFTVAPWSAAANAVCNPHTQSLDLKKARKLLPFEVGPFKYS